MLGVAGYLRKGFKAHAAGSVAVVFALSIPVLIAGAGAAVDFARLTATRTSLQQAVDAAALMGAKELSVANMTHAQVEKAAEADVFASAASLGDGLTASSSVQSNGTTIVVDASLPVPLLIMSIVGINSEQVSVTAGASLEGETQLCALALQGAGPGAFALTGSSRLTAPACSAYSNSVDPQGLQATGSSFLSSGRVCTAGGFSGNGVNYSPLPLTGCPTHSDPLSGLVAPTPDIANCIQMSSISASTVLSPGTYCGGLSINGSAVVTMNPGVYIFTNGDLHVTGSATIIGTNVAIYFSGATGAFKSDPKTAIDLTAPKTGSHRWSVDISERKRHAWARLPHLKRKRA